MVISKVIDGTSGTSSIASGAGEKLRRSRRLSSTRGLRAPRAPADAPDRKLDGRPEVDGESNERVSADSTFHAALEIRAENRRRITDTNIGSEPVLDLLNVSGFPVSADRKCQSGSSGFEKILKSDSKYEIGLPSSGRILSGSESVRRTSKDICTLRKRCKPGKNRPEVQKSRAEVAKPDDSIAKRLEVIHELNRKILANYEKFQQRSKRSSRKDERSCDKDEGLYAEIKKKNKSRQDQKTLDSERVILTSEKNRSKDENGTKKSSKKSCDKTSSNSDVNENFSLASRTSILGEDNSDLRTRITRAAYSVKIKTQEKPAFRELTNVFEKNSKDCLENSKLYPETGCESCTMTRKVSRTSKSRENPGKDRGRKKDDFIDEMKKKNSEENYRREKDARLNFLAKDITRENPRDVSRRLQDDQGNAAKNDRSQEKIPGGNYEGFQNDYLKFTVSEKFGKNPSGLGNDYLKCTASEKFARDSPAPKKDSLVSKINADVLKTESSKFPVNLKSPAGLQSVATSPRSHKKFVTDPVENSGSKDIDSVLCRTSASPCKDLPSDGSLEKAILATLNATIERYDVDRTSLEDSRTSEESFSSDSIVARTSPVKVPSFEVSWDSGVGVDVVGNGSGWVRIHTGIESSLVYLTLDTTAKDVCRDMILGEEFAVYVQYGGEIGRRLAQEERPLELQDFFLQQIGYSDVARRARLGVDPELRHLIAFHVAMKLLSVSPETALTFVRYGVAIGGSWPRLGPKKSRFDFADVLWRVNFCLSVPQFLAVLNAVITYPNDPVLFIRCVVSLCGIGDYIYKLIVCRTQHKILKRITDEMYEYVRLAEAEERAIMSDYANRFSPLYFFLIVAYYVGTGSLIFAPLIGDHHYPIDTVYPFEVDFVPVREIIYAQQIYVVIVCACGGTIDCQVAVLLWYCTARLDILGKDLSAVQDEAQMNAWIARHQDLIRYMSEVKRGIRYIILGTVLVSITCMVFCCLQFTANQPWASKVHYLVLGACCGTILYSCSLPADHLLQANERLGWAVYGVPWTEKSVAFRRKILFVLHKLQNPVIIDVHGFISCLSLDFYATFLLRAMSYYTTMRAVLQD